MKKCILWLFLLILSIFFGFIFLSSVGYRIAVFVADFLKPINYIYFLSILGSALLLYVSNILTHVSFNNLKNIINSTKVNKGRH